MKSAEEKKEKKGKRWKNSKRVDRKIYKCVECACAKCERCGKKNIVVRCFQRDEIARNLLELLELICIRFTIRLLLYESIDNPGLVFLHRNLREIQVS